MVEQQKEIQQKQRQNFSDIKPFILERYFAKYEFKAPFVLSCSDCEALKINDVLAMADQECKGLWENLALCYTESQGHPLLLNEITKLYNQQIKIENIIEVVPQEGIFLTMSLLLKESDHLIAVFPIYQSLTEIASNIGCQIDRWEIEEDKNNKKFYLNFNKLREIIKANTKVIIVNFPHNPTGYLPSQQEFEELISICKQFNCYLFCDEMYRGLELNREVSLPSAIDLYEKAIVLSGMSKTYSMPGIRIGWIACQNKEIIQKIQVLKDYTTICGSAPSQILALIGLRNKRLIENNNKTLIKKNIQIFQKFVISHSDKFDFIEPCAGSTAFVAFKSSFCTSADEYCQQLVDKHGIMIISGKRHFLYSDDLHFRIGLGRLNFEEIVNNWDQILKKENQIDQNNNK